MPIYEYHCRSCGENFSLIQKMNAKEETTCPSCGSTDVEKKISAFACSSGGGSGGSFAGG